MRRADRQTVRPRRSNSRARLERVEASARDRAGQCKRFDIRTANRRPNLDAGYRVNAIMEMSSTRPLLICDLDETLIYGSSTRLHRDADFLVGPLHIYKRPGVDVFLATVNRYYDLAIWSSASGDYVIEIANALKANVREWSFVWSRDRCTQRMHHERFETVYLKDLKKAARKGYSLERILIVDDTREKLSRNYGNAIYITEFVGSDDDGELVPLAKFLICLHTAPNFRRIEKRGWRSRSFPDLHP